MNLNPLENMDEQTLKRLREALGDSKMYAANRELNQNDPDVIARKSEIRDLYEALADAPDSMEFDAVVRYEMTLNEYQRLASRTINNKLVRASQGRHALFGMRSEVGELYQLYQKRYQKRYQGHPFDENHAKNELGNLLWFVAEYCTANDWTLEEIAAMNIDKLKARYPEGFSEEQSLHRAQDDI